MTKKQQFIETFLKNTFNFDEVEFNGYWNKCMSVKGIFRHSGFWTEIDTITYMIDIYIDKTKSGYSIKFKTNPISKERQEEIKRKAAYAWRRDSVIDIYNRHEPCVHKDMPTLRVRVKELPWK